MSRSGYVEDCDEDWQFAMWRGAVASSIRGKRGQAFLQELIGALDAMPEKRLIAHELRQGPLTFRARDGGVIDVSYLKGEVCALGSIGARRGIELEKLDPEDYATLSSVFNVAEPLIQEIEYINDDGGFWNSTPEGRWQRMRSWAEQNLKALPEELAK